MPKDNNNGSEEDAWEPPVFDLHKAFKQNLVMEFPSSTPPKFLTVFFPEISATKLKIPAHVSVVLPKTVTMRDKYKNIWQVKARKVDNQWYFLDGWAKFVEDNSVILMDVLVFNYSGPGSFDVNILGSDGDVKEGVGYHKVDNTKEHQNMESDGSEDDDTLEIVPSGKNKKLEYYNNVKAKGKMGKEVAEYRDDDDEYETDNDFAHNRGQGYWDGEGEESEDSDAFELVYRKNDKCKEAAKELRKSRDDNNASGSRKPHQKKRNVDCLSKRTLKAGLTSKPKSYYSVKRMKPLSINESNRGKGIWNEVSEDDDDEEEEDSEDESLELTPRHDKKGKGRVAKELRADVRTYTAAGSGNPHQKRRNVDDWRGKKFITSRSAPRPKIPSSAAKMPPLRINELGNRGKGILNESSDEDSDSDYLGYEEISHEEFISKRINKGRENAKKLKSKVRDAKAPKSTKPRNRVNVDWLGKDIFESGLVPKPQCTYFVTTMKPKRMNELYIPKDLLMDENLYLPKKMKLVDPSGHTYTARLVSWTDGRTFYKGGWNRLCRRNELRKEDFCICEFGEGDESGYLFISFVRTELRR